jgi:hypothetical protein
MLILLAILFLAFVTYNVYTVDLFGIPQSISETAYLFDSLNGKRWLFSLMCGVIGIGLLIPWIEATVEVIQFLPFLSCACILFCALTPCYKENLEGMVHYVFSGISFGALVAWMYLSGTSLYLLALLFVTFILSVAVKPKSYVYFAEIYSITFLLISLIAFYL